MTKWVRRCRVVAPLFLVALVTLQAVITPAFAASTGADPCGSPAIATLGKVFGPTTARATVVVANGQGCRTDFANGLALTQFVDPGGRPAFDRLRSAHPAGSTEAVHDYADAAFFGWHTQGALEFVARRGNGVTVLRLSGADATSGFVGDDPQASAPGGVVSGSTAGSGLWVVMSQWLADRGGARAKPDAADLTGMWRTNDVTACAPAGQLTARVSRFRQDGHSLSATKVTGDACLPDKATDFRGTVSGRTGRGVAFGSFGGIAAGPTGSAFQLVVTSPTDVRLIGDAGTLQYTREYQRISWPALGERSEVQSGLLGLPTPSEALTARNVVLTAALWALLMAIVVFPTVLFNSTLEENLDYYRSLIERLRRQLPRREVKPDARASFWTLRSGLGVYLGIAGLLFSFMQPGWGPNTATLVTLVGFLGGVTVVNAVGVAAARAHDAMFDKSARGHFLVAPSTLFVAVLFVLASRIVGFVPGYLYGVAVYWELNRSRAPIERGRIIALASVLRFIAAVLAWLAISGLRSWTGSAPGLFRSLPEAFVAGVFVASVHELTIGLIPLRFVAGKHLKDWSSPAWLALWAAGGWLFVLVLLRPGLESAQSHNVIGTCLLAAGASAVALAFWLYNRKRSTGAHPPV